ncbi:MAG: nucleotidyltransferase family protein [Acidobacteria bacterium]|nr:nucleotidyltransferase family protein [Acidobacteriota bacterium]
MLGSIETVCAALNEAGVRYLIVGGVAVVLYGHLRTTVDLDLVLDLREENVRRALQVLDGLGYVPRPPVSLELFADEKERSRWIEEKNMMVFSLWHPSQAAFEVDLFVREPFDFDAAWQRKTLVELEETRAPVVSLQDLVELKERAGRPQDLADLEALRSLEEDADGPA